MNSYAAAPLDAVVAIAKQKLEQLTSIRSLDAMEAGDLSDAV
jgi:hypothetical protein